MVQKCGIDVLVSIFVDYPELNSVKYQAQKDILTVEVVLSSLLDDMVLNRFMNQVKQSLQLYYKIAGTAPRVVEMDYSRISDITFLKLYRDADSLTATEMELFVSIVKEKFDSILIREDSAKISKKNCQKQIKTSLLQGENNKMDGNFIAYRDEGTMFVFNK